MHARCACTHCVCYIGAQRRCGRHLLAGARVLCLCLCLCPLRSCARGASRWGRSTRPTGIPGRHTLSVPSKIPQNTSKSKVRLAIADAVMPPAQALAQTSANCVQPASVLLWLPPAIKRRRCKLVTRLCVALLLCLPFVVCSAKRRRCQAGVGHATVQSEETSRRSHVSCLRPRSLCWAIFAGHGSP